MILSVGVERLVLKTKYLQASFIEKDPIGWYLPLQILSDMPVPYGVAAPSEISNDRGTGPFLDVLFRKINWHRLLRNRHQRARSETRRPRVQSLNYLSSAN
jgi:hypothetical protein